MKLLRILVPFAAILLLCGCAESTITNPPRSVTEQLLLSTAADRAISSTSLELFAQKKVFVDGTYFDSYDSKYVLGAIRDAFSRAGALLVNEATNSEIVVEARSGGLSIDASSSLIGIPNTGVPIPLAGTLQIPELAFWKSSRQNSIAKLALLAYSTKSREHVFSSGPMLGKSFNNYYKFLGIIQWTTTDIPERKEKMKGAAASPATEPDFPSLEFVEQLYAEFNRDRESVSEEWRQFFGKSENGEKGSEPVRFGPSFRPASIFHPATDDKTVPATVAQAELENRVNQMVENYRTRGHLIAHIDPFELPRPCPPELQLPYYSFTSGDLDSQISVKSFGR